MNKTHTAQPLPLSLHHEALRNEDRRRWRKGRCDNDVDHQKEPVSCTLV
eukprot:CAMPEP_0182552264 /NCGR_PEP_ID=MMETSP1323-20130603/47781_1 /TAXON_ID=236787 /ORGANISM="Florenciella parvula, Strain RCC1693" /LENGTH=48 /DNA_ID= /DNA_START= /DNA_END= /DNA_ORIENTATION=